MSGPPSRPPSPVPAGTQRARHNPARLRPGVPGTSDRAVVDGPRGQHPRTPSPERMETHDEHHHARDTAHAASRSASDLSTDPYGKDGHEHIGGAGTASAAGTAGERLAGRRLGTGPGTVHRHA